MVKSSANYLISIQKTGGRFLLNEDQESQIPSSILAKLAERERSEVKSKKFPPKRKVLEIN